MSPCPSPCWCGALLASALALSAAQGAGIISGTVDRGTAVSAVTAVDRNSGKKFAGQVDATTGQFTITGLPLGAAYDCIIDAGAVRLEGVDLQVARSDYEQEQPLTREDVAAITRIARGLNRFENEVEVLAVAGNVQHAAVVLNKKRTTPFYGSRPGEVVWRLELWHFERPEEDWLKAQDELGVVLYRERLLKADLAKKSLTLDPALGGIRPTDRQPRVELGKVHLPGGQPGIRVREDRGGKGRKERFPLGGRVAGER